MGLTDSIRPVLLGVANFYLKCLRRNNVPYRYSAPIVSTNGSVSVESSVCTHCDYLCGVYKYHGNHIHVGEWSTDNGIRAMLTGP